MRAYVVYLLLCSTALVKVCTDSICVHDAMNAFSALCQPHCFCLLVPVPTPRVFVLIAPVFFKNNLGFACS